MPTYKLTMNMEVRKRQINDSGLRLGAATSSFSGLPSPTRLKGGAARALHIHPKKNVAALLAETFQCSLTDALKISAFWNQSGLCENCSQKWKNCHECVNTIPHVHTRKLYIQLQKLGMHTEAKRRIQTNGGTYSATLPIDFDHLLAVPDLYIHMGIHKVCVFVESPANSAKASFKNTRNQLKDHQLKKLGFKVIRVQHAEVDHMLNAVVTHIINAAIKKESKTLSPRMKRLQTILG